MSLTPEHIRTHYPLPVYNYRAEISYEGESVTVAFSEVSGLNIEFNTTTYKESPTASGAAGPRTMQMPAQSTPTTIALKKGLVPAVSIKTLYDWISTTNTNQVEKKDITISLCDEKGDPVVSWTVQNAFPTKLDAPTFDAQSNDAAIESMELLADGIVMSGS